MSDAALAERVDSLESYMKDLSYQALRTEREIERLSTEMREFKNEMRAFKDEMSVFKEEMSAFKDEMLVFKDEMSDFKDEMRAFKDEMRDFKDEMRVFKDGMIEFKDRSEQDRREMNRKWGELANKMGTLVEDLVAPNLPRVARELFGCETVDYFAVRVRRRLGAETMEIDAMIVCGKVALINETKSSLNPRDIDAIAEKLDVFYRFFPEFQDLRTVGLCATLYVDESLVRYATAKRILVMAMGDETMQVLNPEAIA